MALRPLTYRPRAWLVVVAGLAAALAACSATDDNESASAATEATAPTETTAGAAAPDLEDGFASATTAAAGTGFVGPSAEPVALPLTRSIVYTASIELEVDDVESASREAGAIVTRRGGQVFEQVLELGSSSGGQLTLKV